MSDMNVIHVHGLQSRSDRAALVFDRQIESDDDSSDERAELDESAALIATTIYDYTPSDVYWKVLEHLNRLESSRIGKVERCLNVLNGE
jgi:hypothetical protein